MTKQGDFDSFLSNIEPSSSTVEEISRIQNNLRDYLSSHEMYKSVHINTFLSGSYAKHTCIRPVLNDGKRDVDIVVELAYTRDDDSREVLNELFEVLTEKSKYSNAVVQGHSVGIEMAGLEIDVVPVVSEDEVMYIGSSKDNCWEETDPKGHISWSAEINKQNGKKYKPLVKLLKWWRRVNCPEGTRYPKGITFEKIIADNLPEEEMTIEGYLVETMQNMAACYSTEIVLHEVPRIDDPCIEENDLMEGYSFEDFEAFVLKLNEHVDLLGEEGSNNGTWKKILGDEFPSDTTSSGNVEGKSLAVYLDTASALRVSHREVPPWDIPKKPSIVVEAKVTFPDGAVETLKNDGPLIPKGCSIYYRGLFRKIQGSYQMKWQVVNTGQEAYNNGCPRGGFEISDKGHNVRMETTAYSGKHYVQCFIVKNGRCIARSKEFIINVE